MTPFRKRRTNSQDPQQKNAVSILNELRTNLVYKLESQEGPDHAPVFTMSVLVDGQKYIGQGKTKKLARKDAATCALRDFFQFKSHHNKNGVIQMMCERVVPSSNNANNALNNNYDYDFTSDHIENTVKIMDEESEAKKFTRLLKEKYHEFITNKDVYDTLKKFNKQYGDIIEVAIIAFANTSEEASLDELKELEEYLKQAKIKYHAIIRSEANGEELVISSDDEEELPVAKEESSKEINWKMPRQIPQQFHNNSMYFPLQAPIVPQNVPSRLVGPYIYNHQQHPNISPVPSYIINQPMLQSPVNQFPSFNCPPPPIMLSFPPMAPLPPFMPSTSSFHNPQNASNSNQFQREKPAALSYREHRLMKEKEQQKLRLQKEEEERKMRKEIEEQKKLREQKQLEMDATNERNALKRKEQIANYNKRLSEEQASNSLRCSESPKSKSNSSKSKKSVTWFDEDQNSNNSLNISDSAEQNSAKSKEGENSSKAGSSGGSESDLNTSTKRVPKAGKSLDKNNNKALSKQQNLKKNSNKEKDKPLPKDLKENEKSDSLSNSSDNNKKTDAIPTTGKKMELMVFHPKCKKIAKIKDTDSIISKRKVDDIIAVQQPKRLKEPSNDMPSTSNINEDSETKNEPELLIKDEPMSDNESMGGDTNYTLSVNGDEPQQQNNELAKSIKVEPEECIHENPSDVDHKKITENFSQICDNPELYDLLAKDTELLNFDSDLTGKSGFFNNDNQMDSENKCTSWLLGIQNNNYDQIVESPTHRFEAISPDPVDDDANFYLPQGEEEREEIVPYFPVNEIAIKLEKSD